jgi:predicted Zn-dependent peptidase
MSALMMQLTTLANGLRVASRSMPGFETVAVGLFAEAGSRHEEARVNGIAHLYEPMVV